MSGFWHLALLKLDGRDQKPWIWALWVSPDPQVPMGTLGEVVQFLAMFWETARARIRQYPEATVTTIWKMAICKWGISKLGVLKCPIAHVVD